jgi:hypothetical protein
MLAGGFVLVPRWHWQALEVDAAVAQSAALAQAVVLVQWMPQSSCRVERMKANSILKECGRSRVFA